MDPTEFTRTIYHFEDEPATLYWVLKNLRTHYQERHPEWHQNGSRRHTVSDDEVVHEAQFEITLHPSRVKVKVRHWMCISAERFTKECVPKDGDIVLLDAMRPRAGTLTPEGLELFSRYEQIHGVCTYLLTGYGERTQRWVESNPENLPKEVVDKMKRLLLIKPVNVPTFIEKIAKLLGFEDHANER